MNITKIMRKLLLLPLVLVFVPLVVNAQPAPPVEATSNQVAAGTLGYPFVVTPRGLAGAGLGSPTNGQTQAQVAALIASTNNAIIQPRVQIMSTSGGNEYTDMRTSTNPLPSALGVSFTSSALGYDLWAASAAGYGSNVWGVPFRIPGGLLSSGNPFWQDLPNFKYLDTSFYWGMGPLASMRTNAWPNGQTNASVQPGLRIVNGNPFSGIAWLDTRTTFTNSSHGDFVGTNYDGVSMYLPGFGLQQGMLSDAYGNPDPTTGIIDQIGKYSQEAPSYQIALLNDYTLNAYMSINAHRTGDPSYGGQAPLMAIETDHFLDGDNEVIWGAPIQRGGVWDVRQTSANAPTNWLWAFAVDEKTSGSVVSMTNSVLQASNITSIGTVTANSFVGDGLGVTNVQSTNVVGLLPTLAVQSNMVVWTDGQTNIVSTNRTWSITVQGANNTLWVTNLLTGEAFLFDTNGVLTAPTLTATGGPVSYIPTNGSPVNTIVKSANSLPLGVTNDSGGRGEIVVQYYLIDAVGGAPIITFSNELSGLKIYQSEGASSSITPNTNFCTLPICSTNVVWRIRDESGGTGASVGVLTNTLIGL